jgi:hypothetical protein
VLGHGRAEQSVLLEYEPQQSGRQRTHRLEPTGIDLEAGWRLPLWLLSDHPLDRDTSAQRMRGGFSAALALIICKAVRAIFKTSAVTCEGGSAVTFVGITAIFLDSRRTSPNLGTAPKSLYETAKVFAANSRQMVALSASTGQSLARHGDRATAPHRGRKGSLICLQNRADTT